MQLFRPEALRGQDHLYGDVQLVPPVSWQIISYLLLAAVVATAIFLSLASYGRVTVVTGRIAGSEGIFRASTIRAGIVDQILVNEGQSVFAGTPLARIRIATSDGATTLEQKRAAALASRNAIAGSAPDLALRMSQLSDDRAEFARVSTDNGNATTLLVTASVAGVVTGITAHPGDPATPGVPLLSIIPAGTRLEAVLDVPADAAGLIDAGQPVRIAVDAFPYQTFGTIEARLRSVSRAAVPVVDSEGRTKDVFVATAPLASETIRGYGRAQTLRPGMTVSARIETDKRSLVGWLFDPVLAVARR